MSTLPSLPHSLSPSFSHSHECHPNLCQVFSRPCLPLFSFLALWVSPPPGSPPGSQPECLSLLRTLSLLGASALATAKGIAEVWVGILSQRDFDLEAGALSQFPYLTQVSVAAGGASQGDGLLGWALEAE